MINPNKARAIFFQITDPAAKIGCLVRTIESHFLKKEKILIVAEEDKALAYVDELLWKHSPEIFLPHGIVDSDCQECIALTKIKKNLNGARYAFNLCPTPLLIEGPFHIVYDFEDVTTPGKKMLSASRFDGYKAANFLIESRM
jgi:DNA polymerase III subunit chi